MVPEVLVRRRLHLDNMSQQEMTDSHDEYLGLIKDILDRRRASQGGGS